MNVVKRAGITAAILLAAPIFIYAQPPAASRPGINFQLSHVEGSACNFYRNGSWRDAKSALTLLRYKSQSVAADNKTNSAEAFTETPAPPNGLSGESHQVRCNNSAAQPSNQWLQQALAHFRAN